MKLFLCLVLVFSSLAQADTPPPGTVKAKMYTGDGNTALTATGSSLNVNVTNSSGGSTVDQGSAGVESWLVSVTQSALPSNACQETGGHLASIDSKLSTPMPVTGSFYQVTQPVSIASPVPVTGTFWQATQPVSIASPVPITVSSPLPVVISSPVPVTIAATLPVVVVSPLPSGTNLVGKVGIDQTTPGTTNGVQVNAALPAGSNVIGHVIVDTAPTTAVTQSGTWTIQPGNTPNTTAWLVNAVPKVPTPLTVKQAAITIGTSAVRLTTDGSAPSSTRVLLVAQLITGSTANCYLGASSVTSSGAGRGATMAAGATFAFSGDAADYYAICDAASQTFLITEQE